MMACAYPKPKSKQYMISIVNSYTLEIIKTYQAHTQLCTDIHWYHDDSSVFSSGEDGVCCTYSFINAKTETMGYTNSEFCSVQTVSDPERIIYLAGQETIADTEISVIKEESTGMTLSHKLGSEKITNMCVAKTLLGHEAMLIGTENGEIKIYNRKFDEGCYDSLLTHIGPIRKIIVNPTGRYVFSVGDDGLVNIYSMFSVQNGQEITRKSEEGDAGPGLNHRAVCMQKELASIVLVDKKDIVEYTEKLEKHKNEIHNLNIKLINKGNEIKNRLQEEQKRHEERIDREVKMWTERCKDLKQAKQESDSEKHNLLKANDENHLKAVEDLEALYEKKLTHENEKYLQLE